MQAAAQFHLALLEPPLDLLARLPASLRMRDVEFAHFRDLSRLKRPAFVKPLGNAQHVTGNQLHVMPPPVTG